MSDLFDLMIGAGCELDKLRKEPVSLSVAAQSGADSPSNIYLRLVGYNLTRQRTLEIMYDMDKEQFEYVLGRPITQVGRYRKSDDIIEISKREGWKYFDIDELQYDMAYRRITQTKHLPFDAMYGGRYKAMKSQITDDQTKFFIEQCDSITEQIEKRKSKFVVLISATLLFIFMTCSIGVETASSTFMKVIFNTTTILLACWCVSYYFQMKREPYKVEEYNPVRECKPYVCPYCGVDGHRYFVPLREDSKYGYIASYTEGTDTYHPYICKNCKNKVVRLDEFVFTNIYDRGFDRYIKVEKMKDVDERFKNTFVSDCD